VSADFMAAAAAAKVGPVMHAVRRVVVVVVVVCVCVCAGGGEGGFRGSCELCCCAGLVERAEGASIVARALNGTLDVSHRR
jgi:hypothetical protein